MRYRTNSQHAVYYSIISFLEAITAPESSHEARSEGDALPQLGGLPGVSWGMPLQTPQSFACAT